MKIILANSYFVIYCHLVRALQPLNKNFSCCVFIAIKPVQRL
jgi:hypothetical protein